jgi:hypothetical protein
MYIFTVFLETVGQPSKPRNGMSWRGEILLSAEPRLGLGPLPTLTRVS